MNRLLKFFYRFQNQRRIHTWASFWTVVKMAWAQSGRTCDSSVVYNEVIDIESVPLGFSDYDINKFKTAEVYNYDDLVDDYLTSSFGIALNGCKQNEYVKVIFNCNHEYEYSNGVRKCLNCGKENRYYLEV